MPGGVGGGGRVAVAVVGPEGAINGSEAVGVGPAMLALPALLPQLGRMEIFFLRNDMGVL